MTEKKEEITLFLLNNSCFLNNFKLREIEIPTSDKKNHLWKCEWQWHITHKRLDKSQALAQNFYRYRKCHTQCVRENHQSDFPSSASSGLKRGMLWSKISNMENGGLRYSPLGRWVSFVFMIIIEAGFLAMLRLAQVLIFIRRKSNRRMLILFYKGSEVPHFV